MTSDEKNRYTVKDKPLCDLVASSENIPFTINPDIIFNLSDYNYNNYPCSFVYRAPGSSSQEQRNWGDEQENITEFKNFNQMLPLATKKSSPYPIQNKKSFSINTNSTIALWACPFNPIGLFAIFPYYISYSGGSCYVESPLLPAVKISDANGVYLIIQAAGGDRVELAENVYLGGPGGGACCIYLNCSNLDGYLYKIDKVASGLTDSRGIYHPAGSVVVTMVSDKSSSSRYVLAYANAPKPDDGTGSGGTASSVNIYNSAYCSVLFKADGGIGGLPNFRQGGNCAKATWSSIYTSGFFTDRYFYIKQGGNFDQRWSRGVGGLSTTNGNYKLGGAGGSFLSCILSSNSSDVSDAIEFAGGYGQGATYHETAYPNGKVAGDACVCFLETVVPS